MVAIGGAHPLGNEVKRLLQVAMVVFVWTVGIGILNGTDIVDFDRKVVLSHVHAGTLGWITTSVFAASVWLFGATASEGQARVARGLTWYSMIVLPVFALTFAFTYDDPRAILGTLALLAILGVFGWVVVRARQLELTTVHLGFLAAVHLGGRRRDRRAAGHGDRHGP
jgi:magnesium-transporting ATPase (P-type)